MYLFEIIWPPPTLWGRERGLLLALDYSASFGKVCGAIWGRIWGRIWGSAVNDQFFPTPGFIPCYFEL